MTHRIERGRGWEMHLGDCVEVLPTLEPSSVRLVVTSPPYNTLACVAKPSGMWAEVKGGARFCEAVNGRGYADDMPENDYVSWQNAVFGEMSCAADDASLFYNHQLRWRDGRCSHPVQWFNPPGWNLRQEIVWDRGGGMMFNARMFVRFDERILWFVRGKWRWNQSSVGLGTIWRIAREEAPGGKEHPVAFPIDVPMRCIAAASDADDVVLDPFCGSGTSGVAALRLGRKFIGVEREPKYFDLACERLRAEEQGSTLAAARAGQESLFGKVGGT